MRATDIVRQVLDLLDQLEGQHDAEGIESTVEIQDDPAHIENRFKSILAMLNNDSFGEYSNTPNEIVADVSAVTTDAGGGVNGPKDPADIRGNSTRIYGENDGSK